MDKFIDWMTEKTWRSLLIMLGVPWILTWIVTGRVGPWVH